MKSSSRTIGRQISKKNFVLSKAKVPNGCQKKQRKYSIILNFITNTEKNNWKSSTFYKCYLVENQFNKCVKPMFTLYPFSRHIFIMIIGVIVFKVRNSGCWSPTVRLFFSFKAKCRRLTLFSCGFYVCLLRISEAPELAPHALSS